VQAEDKASGKHEKITITNDKGRLSKEEVDRMVQEAEKYKDEDNKIKDSIEARNGLESLAFSLRNTLNEGKLKFEEEDKKTLEAKVKGIYFLFFLHFIYFIKKLLIGLNLFMVILPFPRKSLSKRPKISKLFRILL
jgi:hypothetical protein